MAEQNSEISSTQDSSSAYLKHLDDLKFIRADKNLQEAFPEAFKGEDTVSSGSKEEKPSEDFVDFSRQLDQLSQSNAEKMPATRKFLDPDDPLQTSFQAGMTLVEAPRQTVGGIIDGVNKFIVKPAIDSYNAFESDVKLVFKKGPPTEEDLKAIREKTDFPRESAKGEGERKTIEEIGGDISKSVTGASEEEEPDIPIEEVAKESQFRIPTTEKPRFIGGALVRGMAREIFGFKGIGMFLKVVPGFDKLRSAFAEDMVASPVAAIVFTEKDAQNWLGLLDQNIGLQNEFLKYLANNDPKLESEFEIGLKNVIAEVAPVMAWGGSKALFAMMKEAKVFTRNVIKRASDPKSGGTGKAILNQMRIQRDKIKKASMYRPEDAEVLGNANNPNMIIRAKRELRKSEGRIKTPEEALDRINYANINDSFDIDKLIDDFTIKDAEAILKIKGPKQTHLKIQTDAEKELGFGLINILGYDPGVASMKPAQIYKSLALLTRLAKETRDAAQKAYGGGATEKVIVMKLAQVLSAVNAKIGGVRSDTSASMRAFAAFKKRGGALSDAELSVLQEQIISGAGGEARIDNLIKVFAESDNLTQVVKFSKDSMLRRWENSLATYVYENRLAGPHIIEKNIEGNAMLTLGSIAERYYAGLKNISGLGSGKLSMREANAMVLSIPKSIKDSVLFASRSKRAKKRLARLDPHFDQVSKFEGLKPQAISRDLIPDRFPKTKNSIFGKGLDMFGWVNSRVLREGLDRMDRISKSFNYSLNVEALAARKANSEGLTGLEYINRQRELASNPPPNMHLEAVDMAHQLTLTRDLEGWAGKLQRGVRNIPVVGSFVNPFMRVKGNLLAQKVERTPVFRHMLTRVRAELMAGGERAELADAKMELMSMFYLLMVDLSMDGAINGHLPPLYQDKEKADPSDVGLKTDFHARMRARGRNFKELSFNFPAPGGKTVQVRFPEHPVFQMAGHAADTAQIIMHLTPEEQDKVVSEFILTYWEQFDSVETISGVVDLTAALDKRNPSKDLTDWLARQGGSLIPQEALWRQIRKVEDPTVPLTGSGDVDPFRKKTIKEQFVDPLLGTTSDNIPPVDPLRSAAFQETLNSFKRTIPGLSKQLPAAVNMYAEEIDPVGVSGYLAGLFFAGAVQEKLDDPFKIFMNDNKVPLGMPGKSIGIGVGSKAVAGVKMTDQQWIHFTIIARRPWKAEMDQYLAQGGFDRDSTGAGGTAAEYIIARAHDFEEEARLQILELYPDLEKEVEERRDLHFRLIDGLDSSQKVKKMPFNTRRGAPVLPSGAVKKSTSTAMEELQGNFE